MTMSSKSGTAPIKVFCRIRPLNIDEDHSQGLKTYTDNSSALTLSVGYVNITLSVKLYFTWAKLSFLTLTTDLSLTLSIYIGHDKKQ